MSPKLPTIHTVTVLREGDEGRDRIESLELEFGNGERRVFRRQRSRGHGAVLVVAMPDPETVLLIREYACGVHRYELGLPRGRIDAGETPLQAAERELKEEAGYGARRLHLLRPLTLVPSYMDHQTHVVLARDLYPERLPGDEPETPEVIPWRLDAIHELALCAEFSEGRALAALLVARAWLERHPES